MSSTSSRPKVLFLGLGTNDPDFPIPPHVDKSVLDKQIQTAANSMTEAGYDVKLSLPLMKNGVEELKKDLKEDGKWDLVLVGVGIRTVTSHTIYFEQIMNAIIQEGGPGQKVAFNASLDTTLEAARRGCPI